MSTTKVVDKRNQSEVGEYGIGFANRATAGSSDYEHAFVVWYYSDPQGMRTVFRAAGFYPTSGDAYDLVFGEDGQIVDDSRQNIDREAVVLVNHDVFEAARAVQSQYQSGHTYNLLSSNCVGFVSAVAAAVPGLEVPSQALYVFPSTFIARLFDIN